MKTDQLDYQRSYRGGSWINDSFICRSAFRFWINPSLQYGFLGFRVALALKQALTSDDPRVLRGGSWYLSARYCRSADRLFDNAPRIRLGLVGFRLAINTNNIFKS